MDKVIERHMNWSVNQDGFYCLSFRCGVKRWNRGCYESERQELMRSVGRDVLNPHLSLDWDDAAYITASIREIISNDFVYSTAVVEPAVEFEPMDYGDECGLWIGPLLVWAVVFWGVVFCVVNCFFSG